MMRSLTIGEEMMMMATEARVAEVTSPTCGRAPATRRRGWK